MVNFGIVLGLSGCLVACSNASFRGKNSSNPDDQTTVVLPPSDSDAHGAPPPAEPQNQSEVPDVSKQSDTMKPCKDMNPAALSDIDQLHSLQCPVPNTGNMKSDDDDDDDNDRDSPRQNQPSQN